MSRAVEAREEWRPVVGYEGLYEVSSIGRVRSLGGRRWVTGSRQSGHFRTYPERRLKARLVSGYPCVNLHRDDLMEQCLVHALVLEAFAGPRPTGMQARHLNGIRSDNRIENLAWGTVQENAGDRHLHGTVLSGNRHPMAKLTSDQVRMIRNAPRYEVRTLCLAFGVSKSNASLIRKRKTWTSVE